MEKKIAHTDMTYCINTNCENKEECFRWYENYIFENDTPHSFCRFDENNCIGKQNGWVKNYK